MGKAQWVLGLWGSIGQICRRLGGESDWDIVFVSFVRACEAACTHETMMLARLGCGSSNNPACGRGVPFLPSTQNDCLVWRCPANRFKSSLIDCKLFLVASRCFSLLPAASRGVPAASRCVPVASGPLARLVAPCVVLPL